ncbi:MAG: hypothetical protein V1889_00715 [archaeon]
MSLVGEVKRKREFSELPDSVVERALKNSGGDVKLARALLRKYFGVFLTNRVLKGSGDLLGVHMSSKKRDYKNFYGEIFSVIGDAGGVVDLGCGVNGFSYRYLPDGVSYVGVEAVGQLVDLTNDYFKENNYNGKVVCLDLFDVGRVVKILEGAEKPRVVFMLQVVDALESLERDFSKKFILEVAKECEWIVLTLPTESLGKRRKFVVQRKWMLKFLEENFLIEKNFAGGGEKIIILKNKK